MQPEASSNHNVPTLLRLISIGLIVANHFDFFHYGGGGAILLMVIVGYNIATFKIGKVFAADSATPLISMIVKVAVPTLIYTALLHLYVGPFSWPEMLLVSNFFEKPHPNGFSFWFIEVYLQLQLCLLLLLSLTPVRRFASANVRIASYWFVAITCSIGLLADYLWDLNDLLRRVPWLMMWLLAFGVAARYAQSRLEKAILFACFVSMHLIYYRELNLFVLASFALLVINPRISLPVTVKRVVDYVAAGSLFIYLTHFQIQSAATSANITHPAVVTLLALLIGATLFHIYNRSVNKPITQFFRRRDLCKLAAQSPAAPPVPPPAPVP